MANYVLPIYDTECIGDSLIKINDNFSNLNKGLLNSNSLIDNVTTNFASPFACLRLSLDPNLPIVTSDKIGINTIYLHPFQGNAVGLYNTRTSTWQIQLLPKILAFNLNNYGLRPDANYDIYLSYDSISTSFSLSFVDWKSVTGFDYKVKSSGTKNTVPIIPSGANLRTMLAGVRVFKNDLSKRFIGCLRTTGNTGNITTEISFGRTWLTGGSAPKFYLWNAQNQYPSAFSIFSDSHWTVLGGDIGSKNGPMLNFNSDWIAGGNNTSNINYRVSFITGDPVELSLYQSHWSSGGWCYLTHVADIEEIDKPLVSDCHQQGQFVSESQGMIVHNSNFVLAEGYHFIQSMAFSYGGGNFYYQYEAGNVQSSITGSGTVPGGRHSYGTTGSINKI